MDKGNRILTSNIHMLPDVKFTFHEWNLKWPDTDLSGETENKGIISTQYTKSRFTCNARLHKINKIVAYLWTPSWGSGCGTYDNVLQKDKLRCVYARKQVSLQQVRKDQLKKIEWSPFPKTELSVSF